MRKCKECNELKDSSDYYGVQRECKECTKKRVRLREERLRENPEWVKKEKARQREKYHRLEYKEKHKPTYEMKKKTIERYNKKYPEKVKCKNISQRMKPIVECNQLHHWSYNEEHAKDVIELSVEDHNKIHRFLKYDKKTFMYRDLNGNMLDERYKHQIYIDKVIKFFD